jgi:large subunit ribosomal protein L22
MEAIARIRNARISLKKALVICKELKGKKLQDAKKFLENLINKKISIDGKYYTNTAKVFLELISQAAGNAKFKNMDANKLFIKTVKADKGERMLRYGRKGLKRRKSTHLTMVVEER